MPTAKADPKHSEAIVAMPPIALVMHSLQMPRGVRLLVEISFSWGASLRVQTNGLVQINESLVHHSQKLAIFDIEATLVFVATLRAGRGPIRFSDTCERDTVESYFLILHLVSVAASQPAPFCQRAADLRRPRARAGTNLPVHSLWPG
eukprot:SAG31_NODE_1899_length_6960_cov_18.360880_3_plen_148_part_00